MCECVCVCWCLGREGGGGVDSSGQHHAPDALPQVEELPVPTGRAPELLRTP